MKIGFIGIGQMGIHMSRRIQTAGHSLVVHDANKEKEYVITPACVASISAGEVHWHGATEESAMTHLNIHKAGIHLAE